MLRQTFCHIPGIGLATERRLWSAGIRSWDDVDSAGPPVLSPRRRDTLRAATEESETRLRAGDARYFARHLPPGERWRLFGHFRDRVAFVDIETTGLSRDGDDITTIALFDGQQVRTYVRGQTIDDFVSDIEQYAVIVTFNGACFDLPFIRRKWRIALDHPHIDLRFLLRRVGMRGGLKSCERQCGIERGDLDGVDGYAAVLLWREYECTGDEAVLETLLAYNAMDTVTLEQLMVMAHNAMIRNLTGEEGKTLSLPPVPVIPHKAHGEVVAKVRRAMRDFHHDRTVLFSHGRGI